jgi:hypothetical protein
MSKGMRAAARAGTRRVIPAHEERGRSGLVRISAKVTIGEGVGYGEIKVQIRFCERALLEG